MRIAHKNKKTFHFCPSSLSKNHNQNHHHLFWPGKICPSYFSRVHPGLFYPRIFNFVLDSHKSTQDKFIQTSWLKTILIVFHCSWTVFDVNILVFKCFTCFTEWYLSRNPPSRFNIIVFNNSPTFSYLNCRSMWTFWRINFIFELFFMVEERYPVYRR